MARGGIEPPTRGFSVAGGSPTALYFNELPGRPLLHLQYSAGRCTASSRKTHARILDKNTYTYLYLHVYLSHDESGYKQTG